MGSSHRLLRQVFEANHVITDPGDGGTIGPSPMKDLMICEITSATAETRTLSNPTKPGLRLVLRLYSGGGDVTVTASNGLNVDLDTVMTLNDAGDIVQLLSVTKSTGVYRWQIIPTANDPTIVVSSASPSASPSSSPSASTSASPSTSPSASTSSSPSASTSSSPSAS